MTHSHLSNRALNHFHSTLDFENSEFLSKILTKVAKKPHVLSTLIPGSMPFISLASFATSSLLSSNPPLLLWVEGKQGRLFGVSSGALRGIPVTYRNVHDLTVEGGTRKL